MSYPALYLQARHGCGLRPDMMRIVTLSPRPCTESRKIVDKLPWWLDRVLQCEMTVQEAAAAYGEHQPGPGRKRRFPTFAHYLADRVRYAESSAGDDELRTLLTRTRRGQAGSADGMRVNRLLDTTGREAASRLRELLAELQTENA